MSKPRNKPGRGSTPAPPPVPPAPPQSADLAGGEDVTCELPPAPQLESAVTEKEDIDKRLAFARAQLESCQGLIRAMDSKAQFLIGGAGLLTGTLVPILLTKKELPAPSQPLHYPYGHITTPWLWLIGIFALSALITVATCFYTMYPRLAPEADLSELPGLVYPPLILRQHGNHVSYSGAILGHSYTELLREYAQQICECARIFQKKLIAIRLGIWTFALALVMWCVLIGEKVAFLVR